MNDPKSLQERLYRFVRNHPIISILIVLFIWVSFKTSRQLQHNATTKKEVAVQQGNGQQDVAPFKKFIGDICNSPAKKGEMVIYQTDADLVVPANGELVTVIGETFVENSPVYIVVSDGKNDTMKIKKEYVCYKRDVGEPALKIEPVFRAADIIYKTPAEAIETVGKPTFHKEPLVFKHSQEYQDVTGSGPESIEAGNIHWEKGDIGLTAVYKPGIIDGKIMTLMIYFDLPSDAVAKSPLDRSPYEMFKYGFQNAMPRVGLELPKDKYVEQGKWLIWKPYHSGNQEFESLEYNWMNNDITLSGVDHD